MRTNLVDGLRAKITAAHLPPGLHAHVAGDLAIQVDQQKASGNTGNKVQACRCCSSIVLLVLIFRSFTLAIMTVLPAVFSVTIAGPLVAEAAKHGLQVSPIAQLLLIVLVIGAGTDYGLFLVFRVREELRATRARHERRDLPGHGRALAAACSPIWRIRGRPRATPSSLPSPGSASRSAPRPRPSSRPC